MSTKIYNAYKINNMSMGEIMEELYKVKAAYMEKCMDVLNLLDPHKVIKQYKNRFELTDKLKKDFDTPMRSLFGFDASVLLYFHENDVYIQVFANLHTFNIEDFFDGNLEDFHYQNQADPWYEYTERELTEEEYEEAATNWEIRETVWDEIMGRRYRFAESGLSYDLYGREDTVNLAWDYWDNKMVGIQEEYEESESSSTTDTDSATHTS